MQIRKINLETIRKIINRKIDPPVRPSSRIDAPEQGPMLTGTWENGFKCW